MSIAAMEKEIDNQIDDLPNFASLLRNRKFPAVHPSKLIFTGSGDSYAVALFAQELSGGVALAADPHELSQKTHLVQGKHVVLVSVSGRTRASIQLAEKVRRIARSLTVVTADPDSPLAKLGDERIIIDYRPAGKLTSGTASFTTSLLACARILGRLPPRLSFETQMKKASEWARSLATHSNTDFMFVGSGVQHALAEYGACKIQEVLGAKAEAQFPEQLGHAKLFSIDKSGDAIVGIPGAENDKTRRVVKTLQRKGFKVHIVPATAREPVGRSLEAAFYLQQLALQLAKKRKMKECAFLYDRSRLRLSNQLIY